MLEGLWESPQTDDDPGIETLPVRSGVLGVPDMMTLLWWIMCFYGRTSQLLHLNELLQRRLRSMYLLFLFPVMSTRY